MNRESTIDPIEAARRILGEYIAPGSRDCNQTINRLLAVLDNDAIIEAVDEVKDGRSEEERRAGPQQDQHAQAARGSLLDQAPEHLEGPGRPSIRLVTQPCRPQGTGDGTEGTRDACDLWTRGRVRR